ncbi:hypothetical protein BCR32DRAFT_301197 [Anaeromyces robustus]|uniref:Uncharacterized protein n=1 Tax=Anaeromyces robustus TaxID=1754192 RepID=A0A1Y1X057_9FUNG|nr:hypothetical protein BCR32DRAFT_301197 [Anaeromyces robustus]|eukprot:ORX79072.1 hypothetical protein BCR32DRAFT_301197 [Anaeromyces robustus]
MDFKQTFSISDNVHLKDNKHFMESQYIPKVLIKSKSNHSLNSRNKKNKDLYRKNDDKNYSYSSLSELTEHVYEFSNNISEENQEELYDININEEDNNNHTYSTSSLESIDINSDSQSEKSNKTNESKDIKYGKLKTDEYGFIINDVFHKKTYK